MNTPFAASDFDRALKQSQFTSHRIVFADLYALVTLAGKI
jgi:hypothetical protein